MTVFELNELLNRRFPPVLSCDWDNDGLLVSPDRGATVSGVLIALDLTDAAIDEAVATGCNVILTHHPLIFRPLSGVTPESGVGRRVLRLISLGISSIACHTRADAAPGGLNDALAGLLSLADATPFADGIARIGKLPAPLHASDAVSLILGASGAEKALFSGNAPETVEYVAICCGDGKDCLFDVEEQGADLFLTGELSYHARLDAADLPFLVMEIGHDRSEMHALSVFRDALSGEAPDLPAVLFPHYAGDGFSGGRLDI